MKSKEISVIIPVFNSSLILPELNELINKNLKSFDFEIIYINDYSKDNSWEIIENLCKDNSNVTGINLRKNFGQDNAILAGLRQSEGEYIIIMDDDLQHSPDDIELLYNTLKNTKTDICYGSFISKKHNTLKKSGSALAGITSSWLLKKPKGIYLSPFKAITRSLVNEIIKYDGPYLYIDGLILSITNNISQALINHYPRKSGRGNYNIRRSASVFARLFTGFSILPLRIATYIGLFFTLMGFILIIKYLYDYFIAENYIEGWTTIVVLVIFFSGLIISTLGLIGEFLGRTFLTVSKKPQYSIKKIIKNCDNKPQ